MGRVALQDELEHIDVEPVDPPPSAQRRVSRAWLAAGLVVITLVVATAAPPARDALVRAGFRHADRILVTGHTLALQHQQLIGVLVRRGGASDEHRVRRAEGRLREELRHRYAELRRSLRRDWRLRVDGQTDRFRLAVQRTLEPPLGDPAVAAEAEARARSLRERWRVARARAGGARLRSADDDVAALQRYVDRPTRVRLVIGGREGLTELDLDRSTTRPHRGPGTTESTEMWDPQIREAVRRLPGRAVAVSGDRVAWVERGPAPMTHITDASTGADVAAVPMWGDVAAFSPDRTLLALGHPRGLTVVHVASGRVEHVPITHLANTPIWDPSGRYLFFQSGSVGGWDAVRHEMFRPRLPDLPAGWVLLAALSA